ncbi:outer membrane protein assembly factor BamE [Methyloterricola oryzae]|uniref:outer membrane protein assembly factor BamE n=1 Tax=Methyloterricola oryzae TaxID=1495050 RepID=UPI000699EE3F|nr:outer membrane protein assembly factor BamE [Methyloterricola oryzae]
MRRHRLLIVYLCTLLSAGCSWQDFKQVVPWVYTQDINQGNIISQEMVDQLRPGMNKRQVTFIMGTPLLHDPFHDERWDYIYSNEPGGEPRVQKRITLVFKDDELAGLQGDFRPGNLPSIEPSKDVTVNIPKIDREKTLWETLRGWFGADS